jgi:hypothetical protein
MWCKAPGVRQDGLILGMHAYFPQQILYANLISYQRYPRSQLKPAMPPAPEPDGLRHGRR